MMQIHRVLVILLIYMQTVLPSFISTNSLRRQMFNFIKNTNNNNQGGILTHKGKKIELTPDGNFIICGIDSLEDDYYGCQSSYEVYTYKTYRTSKSKDRQQVSMAATKGSSVKKKENTEPKPSSTALLTPITKPTIMVVTNCASTRRASLFSPTVSDKLFDYLNTVRPSRSIIKNTSSSTTPIFATSSETRHPLRPSAKTAPTSNVGNLIKQQSRSISILKTTTPTPKTKPTIMKAYYASERQADMFSPRASNKLFDYLNTVRPSRSLFKNTKSSSTTPMFATSSETRHTLRPRSKTTTPTSNFGNLIKQKSKIISIPKTTTPTPKSKPTIMLAYYASERQTDLFRPRASDKLFDCLGTVSPSRPLFKRTKSSTTPIFATSAETCNPIRTNSKKAPTNNVGNFVKLKSSIIPIFRTLKAESYMPIETPAGGPAHMPSTRSIVWRADTQPDI